MSDLHGALCDCPECFTPVEWSKRDGWVRQRYADGLALFFACLAQVGLAKALVEAEYLASDAHVYPSDARRFVAERLGYEVKP